MKNTILLLFLSCLSVFGQSQPPTIPKGGPGAQARRFFIETNQASSLSNIVAARVSGDVVELGYGTFHVGNQTIRVPVGVTLRGQGMYLSTISGTVFAATNSIVQMMSDIIIEDLSITAGNRGGDFQYPLACLSSKGHPAASNVIVRRISVDGESDVFQINHTNWTSGVIEDSVFDTKWDGLMFEGSDIAPDGINDFQFSGRWSVYRTRVTANPSNSVLAAIPAQSIAHTITSAGVWLDVVDSTMIATNGKAAACVYVTGSKTNYVRLYGGNFIAAGTNSAAIINDSTGIDPTFSGVFISSENIAQTDTTPGGSILMFANEQRDLLTLRQLNGTIIASSNIYAANFIQTNGYNFSTKQGWLSTNLQWRLVKMGTLTNVVDVSAAAYYPSNNSFFTVHNNNSGRITEWTLDGVFLRNIDGSGNGLVDVESISYLGGNKFAVVEEDLNNIYIITITNNAAGSTWTTNNTEMFELPSSIGVDGSGSGVEGVAYDWDRKLWWIAKEKAPAQLLIVTNDSSGVYYTNNWFTTAQMQTFTNANITDFSDIFLDRDNQVLWVAQDEGAQFDRVIGISLRTSNIVSIINATNFGQLEGFSITTDGYAILGGEANQFAIYEPVIGGLNSGISWDNFRISTNTPALPTFPYGTSVGRFGVYMTNWFSTNITINFPQIDAQTETNQQFSLAWATTEYGVTINPSVYTAGVSYSGQSSNGVVYVIGHNYSTTAKDPASMSFRVSVFGWKN